MTAEGDRSKRRRKQLALGAAAIAVLLALVLGPPYISISRYKSRITQLVSTSLGRPVRLSSVELRLLPRPGFVITDLTVQEDPAYGAEPILHANTVVAAIRLFSLWRGRLELSRISVDEASVNLVRNGEGHWNLDPFFRAATAGKAPQGEALPPLPYLEATNSRINVKNGIEKLPYSLVNADLSFWQENPGEWRVRMRGQPARTDVSLDLADTGIVRLEASFRRAPELSRVPIHLELDWREAQLGQLSRLVVGSDPGWRGNLTGQMQLDGTAQAAQVKTRLTATGVHRAEFAPTEPLDFDANCSFEYRYFDRSVEKLSCDSPLGDGHIKLTGELPGDRAAKFSVEAQRVPVSAGLDMLRTLRSGFDSDLEAGGTISGRIAYDPSAPSGSEIEAARAKVQKKRTAKSAAADVIGPLTGSLVAEGLRLSGGGLSQPIQVSKPVTFQPVPAAAGQSQALAATLAIPAGGAAPLAVAVQVTARGYEATVRGPASLLRLREFARVAGIANVAALEGLAGDPASLDLNGYGPWLSARSDVGLESAGAGPLEILPERNGDQLAGTVALHNANWRSDALANHIQIAQAVLRVGGETAVWDPIEFTDGPVKGTARFQPAPPLCSAGQECPPELDLQFDELDAAQLQAALLGAKRESTVISDLIERFSSSSTSAWPRMDGTMQARILRVGPIAIENAVVSLRLAADGAEITHFGGNLFGGVVSGTGKLTKGDKPGYSFDGKLEKANATAVCRIFSLRCTGGPIEADGSVTLSGFTDKDLGGSAAGSLHFEWSRGSVQPVAAGKVEIPQALTQFSRWTADAKIGGNAAVIAKSEVERGTHKANVELTVTIADQPSVNFAAPKASESAKR